MSQETTQKNGRSSVPLDKIVSRLYLSRQKRNKDREKLRKAAERLGGCLDVDGIYNGTHCYDVSDPEHEWCDVCKEKQPIWEEAKNASREAGEALKAVLRYGKYLVG